MQHTQSSHWYTIFANVEEEYHPSHQYTLHELFMNHILDNKDTVKEICHKAEKQEQLKLSITTLKKNWESRLLDIEILTSEKYLFALPEAISPVQRVVQLPREKSVSLRPGLTADDTLCPSTHVLAVSNLNKLLVMIEDELVNLQVLVRSPYLGALMKGQAEHWTMALTQLQELLSLLTSCQEKV